MFCSAASFLSARRTLGLCHSLASLVRWFLSPAGLLVSAPLASCPPRAVSPPARLGPGGVRWPGGVAAWRGEELFPAELPPPAGLFQAVLARESGPLWGAPLEPAPALSWIKSRRGLSRGLKRSEGGGASAAGSESSAPAPRHEREGGRSDRDDSRRTTFQSQSQSARRFRRRTFALRVGK